MIALNLLMSVAHGYRTPLANLLFEVRKEVWVWRFHLKLEAAEEVNRFRQTLMEILELLFVSIKFEIVSEKFNILIHSLRCVHFSHSVSIFSDQNILRRRDDKDGDNSYNQIYFNFS